MEGEAPNIVGVSPSDDHAELHGPIECLMRARCIHEQGGWHSITSAFLHPWPHVEDAQAYVQPVFLGAHHRLPSVVALGRLLSYSAPKRRSVHYRNGGFDRAAPLMGKRARMWPAHRGLRLDLVPDRQGVTLAALAIEATGYRFCRRRRRLTSCRRERSPVLYQREHRLVPRSMTDSSTSTAHPPVWSKGLGQADDPCLPGFVSWKPSHNRGEFLGLAHL